MSALFARLSSGRQAVNARRRTVVDFGGDPYGEARNRALTGEIAGRLQGAGGHIYVGDRGDPVWSFTGYANPPQGFVGATPPLAVRPAAGTYHAASPTIDTAAVGNNPYADPAARIFAQRLARR